MSDLIRPACLLAPIEGHSDDEAFAAFAAGRRVVHFGTDAYIGGFSKTPIRDVYLKHKKSPFAVARGKYEGVTSINPRTTRLPGHDREYKFYYAFSGLTRIEPIPLSELQHYRSGKHVLPSAPRPYLIRDPSEAAK
jgi:hypothetical protein